MWKNSYSKFGDKSGWRYWWFLDFQASWVTLSLEFADLLEAIGMLSV